MTRAARITILLALLLGLQACGGSGGSDSLPPPPPVENNWDRMSWDDGEWT